jgi:hypothetical protein
MRPKCGTGFQPVHGQARMPVPHSDITISSLLRTTRPATFAAIVLSLSFVIIREKASMAATPQER